MKKNYFMLAATTMMLAACAETDVVNEIAEPQQQAISFETFANKATRAENSSETEVLGLEQHHGNFSVWGYKDVLTTDYVFKNVTVTADGENWKYSPTKYWDKAANTYEFYAAAPVDAKWVLNEKTTAQDDDFFTYANLELTGSTHASTSFVESFKSVAGDCDLMIASAEKVGETDILNAKTVQLDFNHILSRLNITVKKDDDIASEIVVLTSIKVKGLVNIASFDESNEAVTSASKTTARWEKTTNTYDITGNTLAEVTSSKQYVLQSLVIPQDADYEAIDRNGTSTETKPYLYIEYTIGGEPFNATYNLANAFNETSKVAFNEGWQNTLNITLNASSIVFDANTYKWEDSGVDKDID